MLPLVGKRNVMCRIRGLGTADDLTRNILLEAKDKECHEMVPGTNNTILVNCVLIKHVFGRNVSIVLHEKASTRRSCHVVVTSKTVIDSATDRR